ncbi:MAG: glycoside hydrolase family 15 protein [Myxococcales bacterium]|nr:glycoside hydrolase family 15 protein [Myxococcales bacterium]
MSTPLEDYALLGDCHSAALVDRRGSIDWLCLPRFDSAACFAALLGAPEHGRWALTAADAGAEVRRRYVPGTMVLETEYRTPAGVCRVVDCMAVAGAESTLVRVVEGVEGAVTLALELCVRFDYGASVPWLRALAGGGVEAFAGPDSLRMYTRVPLTLADATARAEFTVEAGRREAFMLVWYPSHVRPEAPPAAADVLVARTIAWWEAWAGRCTYEGVAREQVLRSLLTLKALTYAPTGGIVAAPTTSLPERLGGVRNWDYRHCWLRDATFTLYALLSAGYREEAVRWREWLVRAVAGTPNQINTIYGLAGERRLTESELAWLPGYEGSRPVRVGNAAYQQLQLDVFGEVVDTLHVARRSGIDCDEESWRVQQGMLEYLESAWSQPDEGIWEVRGRRRHFTHSKVMAWVALDRGIQSVQLCEHAGPVERWAGVRAAIHAEVCARGFDRELGSFVQAYGGKALDASLLMMSLVGFLPASDPRIAGTVAAIERTLLHDGLVRRYLPEQELDGQPCDEGVFLACSFWLADNYLLLGRAEEARRLFDRLLGFSNDVGLLAEEYDVRRRRMVGNFPQAFSHIALINSACNLSQRGGPAADRSRACRRRARGRRAG